MSSEDNVPRLYHIVVALLAAARLTRFITTDWLGEWMVVQPLKRAAKWDPNHYELDDPRNMHYGTKAQRVATGLDCPHCVSFWAVLLILVAKALPLPPLISRVRDLLIGSLAGSYVVGNVASTLDK